MKNNKKISFGISKKTDGQMILSDDPGPFLNRKKFFNKKNIDIKNVVLAKLNHGNSVKVVNKNSRGKIINSVDALISGDRQVCLSVTVGDCLPILFYDDKNQIIGIAHSGWRGTLSNISFAVIKKMEENFKSNPKNIKIFIGPHIKKCHFEIKKDLIDKFKIYNKYIIYRDDKIFVDLEKIIVAQLLEVGVLKNNISISGICTYCNKNYFSFRRDRPEKVASQIAYIMLN